MKKFNNIFFIVSLLFIAILYFYFIKYFNTGYCINVFQYDLFGIVFINIFVSCFHVYLVIKPLANVINRSEFNENFTKMFIARFVLLVFGNVLCPEMTILFDVLSLIFCVLFIVPIVHLIKKVFYASDYVYDNYVETDLNMVRKYFNDVELLKQVLISKYNDMNAAICEFDYKKLDKLCSSDLCLMHKNNIQLLKNVGNKKYFSDFVCKKSKIFKFNVTDEEISIVLVSKMQGLEYTLDKDKFLVDGSNCRKKVIVVKLYFSQKLYKAAVRECPNCGASASKKSLESCEYCGTLLNYKPDELVITREKRVYDK